MACAYPQIVLLGDSLFQQSAEVRDGFSFQGALQSRFIRRFDVVNRGFSGWNTKNLLEYLDRIIPLPTKDSPRIKYLAILIGANDASLPVETNRQHVPIDSYKENLGKIVNHPHVQAHKPKIIIVAPPPVDEFKMEQVDRDEGHAASIRSSAVSASYSEKAREVAREHPGAALVELWQGIMDRAIAMAPGEYTPGGPWLGSTQNGKAGGLDKLLPDGLHMSGEAYRVFFELFVKEIDEEDASTVDQSREYVFPPWVELNTPNLPKYAGIRDGKK